MLLGGSEEGAEGPRQGKKMGLKAWWIYNGEGWIFCVLYRLGERRIEMHFLKHLLGHLLSWTCPQPNLLTGVRPNRR